MINRKEKEQKIARIASDLEQAGLIIVTDYRGLNVLNISRLRRSLKAENCRYHVAKNTLSKLACRRIGLQALERFLEGPTAIAFTSADPVAAARVFLNFGHEQEGFSIKGGWLDGQLLDPAQVKVLGEIPSREVLLARVCGGFSAPIYGLAGVLQGNLRKLVYTLDAVSKVKASA